MLRRIARATRGRMTVANVIAFLALFVALGGSPLAAPAREAASSLGSQVKRALKIGRHADRTAARALTIAKRADAKASVAVPGPVGAPGPAGPAGPAGATGAQGLRGAQGAPGSGLGYAGIEYCPNPTGCEDFGQEGWFSSDDSNSTGIDNTVNFWTPAGTHGIFCYRGLPFTAHVVMATIGRVPATDPAHDTTAYTLEGRAGSVEHPLTECAFPAGTDDAHTAAVFYRDATGALAEPDHDARIYVLFG
jgi:hypothetical protein